MKIGFDIDGVFAAFIPAYQDLCIELNERDLFHPGDNVNPPCWNWPEYRGYTKEEVGKVWETITASNDFWITLRALPGLEVIKKHLAQLYRNHDIYFVTSRPGTTAKWQTEWWLDSKLYFGGIFAVPTVLIASDKGGVAKALKLDVYIDDNWDNAVSVAAQSPLTRNYLLDTSYNRYAAPVNGIIRVSSVAEMFDREKSLL